MPIIVLKYTDIYTANVCFNTGDTMTVQDPVQMNLCSAVWAVTAYVVADLDDMLPRDKDIHVPISQH